MNESVCHNNSVTDQGINSMTVDHDPYSSENLHMVQLLIVCMLVSLGRSSRTHLINIERGFS